MIVEIKLGQFQAKTEINGGEVPIHDLNLAFTPFIRGERGLAGDGIEGGETGQVLAKASNADGDYTWTEVLHAANRLSEFSTPQAKRDARESLELQHIDGGTFF